MTGIKTPRAGPGQVNIVSHPGKRRARVVIIGGGFAGAATAYFLARAGVRGVIIVERERVCGAHASGRNAGICRQLAEPPFLELTVEGARFLAAPPPEVAAAPLATRSGGILVGTAARIAALAASAAAVGIDHEPLAVAQIARRAPWAAGVTGEAALWIPGDGVIDVHAALSGYLRAARGRGAEVWTGCEARDVRAHPDAVAVTCGGTIVEAEALVVAAGAWAGELAAGAGSRVELAPLRRHLFISAPDPSVAAGTPWIWLEDVFYARPESGGLLLCGCDESPHPATPPSVAPGAAEELAERLARHAPPLAELRLRRGWACLRTFGPERAPVIGWDERAPRLFLVAGLGGHGATGSAAVGRRAAEAIVARIRT